jgi:hypothetical protein
MKIFLCKYDDRKEMKERKRNKCAKKTVQKTEKMNCRGLALFETTRNEEKIEICYN